MQKFGHDGHEPAAVSAVIPPTERPAVACPTSELRWCFQALLSCLSSSLPKPAWKLPASGGRVQKRLWGSDA